MKAIRPRQSRLFIDDARALFTKSPWVLKVTARRDGLAGDMDITVHKIEHFDIDFANNFFYPNDLTLKTESKDVFTMLMVPFNLNGDE